MRSSSKRLQQSPAAACSAASLDRAARARHQGAHGRAPMVISPGNKRPGTRSIDAVSSTPLGSTRAKRATGDYTLPPSQGERESEGKRRNPRRVAHLKMKVRTVRRRVTTTSRSAVTNLTWNLSTPTTQSMSTIQMTQTDADAHLFCFPRCHVYFVLASVGSR